jgi:membrane protease YdiL (CAAX protease family)
MERSTKRTIAWWGIAALVMVLNILGVGDRHEEPEGSEKIAVRVDVSPVHAIMLKFANGLAAPEIAQAAPGQLSALEGQLPPLRDDQPGDAVARAIILARIGKPVAALESIDLLEASISAGDVTADESTAVTIADVRTALSAIAEERTGPEAITTEQSERLADGLGNAGRTVVALARDDRAELASLEASGLTAVGLLVLVVVVAALLGLGGLAALVVFAVLAVMGRTRGVTRVDGASSAVHAEVFGVWMALFWLLGLGASLVIRRSVPEGVDLPVAASLGVALATSLAAFVGALWWGSRRGLTWRDLRAQLGWTRARFSDVLWGVVTYSMALPLLGVGLLLAFLLSSMAGAGAPQPSHPIQEIIAGAAAGELLLALLVAAVMAPVTEEVVFRGAFYRSLRDTLGRGAPFVGAVLATAVSSFVFAAIHPQGWTFIPVLGALAVAFCISREWTGSINPAIVAHAINNFAMVMINVVLMR